VPLGPGYGAAVAAELAADPDRVFKTLVVMVDDAPAVAIIPVVARLSMKSIARAVGGKRALLAETAAAERITGYVQGGISPFAQRRRLPTVLDVSAVDHDTVFVSGGKRGVQIEIAPDDLVELTGARIAGVA